MLNADSNLAQSFWQEGSLKDCPVYDMHAHMGSFYGGYIPLDTPEQVLAAMQRSNVPLCCFVSHASSFAPQVGKEHDLAIAKKYPDSFKLYHIVASQELDQENDLERIENNKEHYVGLKFLADYYKVPLSHESHTAYWQYANANKLLVLSHTWGGSAYNGLAEAEKILALYPDLVFIAGHSFHGQWQEAAKLASKYPNLYLELTAVLDDRGALEILVNEAGSQQILFGVDMPWFSYDHGIGAVLSAKITDEDRKNIFYRNAQSILQRFPWFKCKE